MRGSSDAPLQTLEWQVPGQRGSASLGSVSYSPATRGLAGPCRRNLTDSYTRAGTSTASSLFRTWIAILASAVLTIGTTRPSQAQDHLHISGRTIHPAAASVGPLLTGVEYCLYLLGAQRRPLRFYRECEIVPL